MIQRYYHAASHRDAALFSCCVTSSPNVIFMLGHTVSAVVFMLRHTVTLRYLHAASRCDAPIFPWTQRYYHAASSTIFMLRHIVSVMPRHGVTQRYVLLRHTVTQPCFHAASRCDAACCLNSTSDRTKLPYI